MMNALKRIRLNHDLYKHNLIDCIRGSKLSFSCFKAKRIYYSIFPDSLLRDIDTCLLNLDFEGFKQLVDNNILLLTWLGKGNIILKRTLYLDVSDFDYRYFILAVYSDPKILSVGLFTHVRSKFRELDIDSHLFFLIENKLLSRTGELYVRHYLGIGTDSILLKNIRASNRVRALFLSEKHKEICYLYINENNNYNKFALNAIFTSLIITGDIRSAKHILVDNRERISNSNLVNYYYSQALPDKGFLAMKKRDIAHLFYREFPVKYIQDLSDVNSWEQLLVCASWGVGDDIRFSVLIPQILKKHKNVTFSCEPRLYHLLSITYPEASFFPSSRTKVITPQNYQDYDNLPNNKLHHAMDNNLYGYSKKFDKICLMTDLVSIKNCKERKSSPLCSEIIIENVKNKAVIDDFLNVCRRQRYLLVGLCWRSMLTGPSRNDHYFDLKSIFNLARGRKIKFISLQYDLSDSERDLANIYSDTIDFLEPPVNQMEDFLEVIYLMSQLDHIVSAGTVSLELAGLSGTSTYLLSNSISQRYRFKSNKDIWFDNINVIDDFYLRSKSDVIKETLNTIERAI
ncbi:hypothetical protein QFW85_03890 [Vibrio chagasii]|uniref:hypothetical protein n=1 Tax=Vibrio chagasii TaxID=170679 RepID=UPI003DA858BA